MLFRLVIFCFNFYALLCTAPALGQGVKWLKGVHAVPPGSAGTPANMARLYDFALDNAGFAYAFYHGGPDLTIGAQVFSMGASQGTGFLVKYNPNGGVVWVKPMLSPSPNAFGGVRDMEVDQDGNLYLTGKFWDGLTLDGVTVTNMADPDYYLAKWNAAGVLQWVVNGGGPGDREGLSIAVSPTGEVYLSGYYSAGNSGQQVGFGSHSFTAGFSLIESIAFLIKYSDSGVMQWVYSAHNNNANSRSYFDKLHVDDAGRIHVEAVVEGTASFRGATFSDPNDPFEPYGRHWLVCDSAGMVLRQKTLPGQNGIPTMYKMAVSPAGEAYVTSGYFGTLDLGGITLTSPANNAALFAAKYDVNGVLQWARNIGNGIGSNGAVGAGSPALDQVKHVYATGVYMNQAQIDSVLLPPANQAAYMVAFDATTGELSWVETTSDGFVQLPRITANQAGQVLVGGSFGNTQLTIGNAQTAVQTTPGLEKSYTAKLVHTYNTISGTVYVDLNLNGQKDSTETGHPDGVLVEVLPTGESYFTSLCGHYTALADTGIFAVSLPNPPAYYNWVANNPTSQLTFSSYGNSITGLNFAMQPLPDQQDLVVYFTPLFPARPGFGAAYRVTYKNIGTVPIAAGSVSLAYSPYLTFDSSSVATISATNSVAWQYANLLPAETRQHNVYFTLDSLATLGDTLAFAAAIDPITGDNTPINNTATAQQIVVGSYDPNDITVSREQISVQQLQTGEWLEYVIRFQNTGSDTAFTVMLRDQLPADKLMLSSLQLLASSHTCNWHLGQNALLTLTFSGIKLPQEAVNEVASHGFVRFRIKANSGLTIGEIILNQAHIYFDYNQPITTNTAETEVVQLSSAVDQLSPDVLQIYPNPANESVRVKALFGRFAEVNLRLLNVLGQEVYNRTVATTGKGFEQEINLRHLPSGVYSVQLQTGQGNTVKRLVKQ